MQINIRYVTKMSELRRAGKPEISLSEFKQTIDKTNFWGRLTRQSQEFGMLHFRKAGLFIGEGQVLLGGLNLIAAAVFYPKFVTRRLFALRKDSR